MVAQALTLCKVNTSVASEARAFAGTQRAAVRKYGWNGQWMNRAWLPHKGFIGTNAKGDKLGITMEPQVRRVIEGLLYSTVWRR